MFRHLGHHLVKKYNHSLIVDPVYDQKPTRISQVLTSASSRHSKDRSVSQKQHVSFKRTRNLIFSPHVSLQKYREKSRCQNLQNVGQSEQGEVKLLISTLVEPKNIHKRFNTPTKQPQRDQTPCSQCQNRQKTKTVTKFKCSTITQQNPEITKIIEHNTEQLSTQQITKPKLANKIVFLVRKVGRNQTVRDIEMCSPCLHGHGSQFKPWEMNASESSI